MQHLEKAWEELKLFVAENELRTLQVCLAFLVFSIIMMVLAPFFTIWSLNALGFQVPITLKTWVGACWLTSLIHLRIPSLLRK